MITLSPEEIAYLDRFCYERDHFVDGERSVSRQCPGHEEDLNALTTFVPPEIKSNWEIADRQPPPIVSFPWNSLDTLRATSEILVEASTFELTDPERNFLSHWMWEASCVFHGPAIIWLWHNAIRFSYAPFGKARLLSEELHASGHLGWYFDRPPFTMEIPPWRTSDEFWHRATVATAMHQQLRTSLDDYELHRAQSALFQIRSRLTPGENEFLRAYNQEMMQTGNGYHVTLAYQHGVMFGFLIPFFFAAKDLYDRPSSTIVPFPWSNFPARYEGVSGWKYRLTESHLLVREGVEEA
jgi:hypothetical protein